MKPRLLARLLLLVPLLVSVAATAQALYKWVDDNGKVTYSDQPPLGKVKTQEVVKIPGAATSDAARQIADKDTQFKKRQDDTAKRQAEAAKKQQDETVRQDNCARARGSLRALRENVPLSRMNEAGETIILDSGAREAESKRLETFVEESCAQASG
jgi:Domain of unknown function (DUF4124)